MVHVSEILKTQSKNTTVVIGGVAFPVSQLSFMLWRTNLYYLGATLLGRSHLRVLFKRMIRSTKAGAWHWAAVPLTVSALETSNIPTAALLETEWQWGLWRRLNCSNLLRLISSHETLWRSFASPYWTRQLNCILSLALWITSNS